MNQTRGYVTLVLVNAEPRWLTERESLFWRGFINASSGIVSALDSRLKKRSNISFDDYEVLVHLSEAAGERMRMSDLSDALLHSRSRLSQRIDRMVTRGLVARERVEDDLRGTWAVLTDVGRETIEAAAPGHVEDVRECLLDHVNDDELSTLAESFDRIADTVRPTID